MFCRIKKRIMPAASRCDRLLAGYRAAREAGRHDLIDICSEEFREEFGLDIRQFVGPAEHIEVFPPRDYCAGRTV